MLRLTTDGLPTGVLKRLLLVPLSWTEGAWTVNCASTSYDLHSQAELDALGATGCDSVPGNLIVGNASDLTYLDGLANDR